LRDAKLDGHRGLDTLHHARTGLAFPRGFEDAIAAFQRRADRGLLRGSDLGPTDRFTTLRPDEAGPGNPGMNSFLNDRSFEFRKDTEHLEKRLASWRGSIDSLAVEVEVDTSAFQLTQKPD
jgi:hypothetical protein